MNNDLKLTIAIPSYNAKVQLERLLKSIYTGAPTISFEVIVSDDASTDGTQTMINDMFPHVCFITHSNRVGVSISTQDIIASMKGEYLLRLDADTEVTWETITHLVTYLDEHPSVGAVSPMLVNDDGSFQPSYETHFKAPLEWFWDYSLWIKKVFRKGIKAFSSVQEVSYLATAAVLFRSTAVHETGGLDPHMEFFMEDADWLIRIHKAGWKIIFDPRVKIIHVGGQSGRLYIHTRNISLKNIRYFYKKHVPGVFTVPLLDTAILSGSLISLILALIAVPFLWWTSKNRIIVVRSLKSFSNVFAWYTKKLLRLNIT